MVNLKKLALVALCVIAAGLVQGCAGQNDTEHDSALQSQKAAEANEEADPQIERKLDGYKEHLDQLPIRTTGIGDGSIDYPRDWSVHSERNAISVISPDSEAFVTFIFRKQDVTFSNDELSDIVESFSETVEGTVKQGPECYAGSATGFVFAADGKMGDNPCTIEGKILAFGTTCYCEIAGHTDDGYEWVCNDILNSFRWRGHDVKQGPHPQAPKL